MPWQLTPYTIPLVLAATISAALGVYGIQRYLEDRSALAAGLVLTMVGAAVWAGLYLLQIADAHGWAVRAAESADGGARFDVTGLETIDLPGAAGPEPETANDD